MLQVGLDLITADPRVLGGCIKYIENEVRPAVESQPGSLGLSLLASPEPGAAVLESFWASPSALEASSRERRRCTADWPSWAGRSVRPSSGAGLLVFEREAPLRGGEGVRLTRIEVKPSAVADVIEAFGGSVVPGWRKPPDSAARCCSPTRPRGA